jgi:AraC family ethanolamine operon transcriptional activator
VDTCDGFNSPAPLIATDPVVVSVAELHDVDDYGATLPGWASEVQQLSSGVFSGHSSLVSFAGVQLFREVTSQRMCVKFATKANSRSIALPLALSQPALFSGTEVNHREIVCFAEDDAFTYYTAQSSDLLTLSFDTDAFTAYADQIEDAEVAHSLNKTAFLKVMPEHAKELQRFLQAVLNALLNNPATLRHQQAQDSLTESIYTHVLKLLGSGDNLSAFTMPKQRYALVARAREYLFHDPDNESFTIGKLCRYLGVSSRTLEYAFQDVLGMTALSYLRALRLNYVRQDIKSGGPQTSVLDVAARWGFWHPSHFSADYKRLFGDLPSETRRRYAN